MGDSFSLATCLAVNAARSTEAAMFLATVAAAEPPLVIIAAIATAKLPLVLLPATSSAAMVPRVAIVLAFIVPVGSAAVPSLFSRTRPASVAEILPWGAPLSLFAFATAAWSIVRVGRAPGTFPGLFSMGLVCWLGQVSPAGWVQFWHTRAGQGGRDPPPSLSQSCGWPSQGCSRCHRWASFRLELWPDLLASWADTSTCSF